MSELALGAWLGGAVCYLAVLTAPTPRTGGIPFLRALAVAPFWPLCLAAQRAGFFQ